MPSSRRGARFSVSAWLPVLLMSAAIALESTIWFGADHTSGPMRIAWQFLFGPVDDAHWRVIHPILRKSGHFLGYGVLGLTWLRAWRMSWPLLKVVQAAGLALAGTVLVASADEFHQSFLPNRTGSVADVALDSCGALAMLTLASLPIILLRRWRQR